MITVALFFLASTVAFGEVQDQTAEGASFEERLGPDDGAALAILFGANMRGNLELCDCTFPRGGLARRIGYVEGFRRKFKDTPVLHVEAGFLFYNSSGNNPAVLLQNEQIGSTWGRPTRILTPRIIRFGVTARF